MEQSQSLVPLRRAQWCYSALSAEIKRHPLIGTSSWICAWLISQASLSSPNSPLYPKLGNPQFTPGMHDAIFRGLNEAGLHQASHFSSGGHWKTVTELSDFSGPFRLDFLRALQLSHFLNSKQPPADIGRPTHNVGGPLHCIGSANTYALPGL